MTANNSAKKPRARHTAPQEPANGEPSPTGIVRFPIERTTPPETPAPSVTDFIQDGSLVPARRPNAVISLRTGSVRDQILNATDVLDELRQAASATNTRRSYGGHVLAFAKWCEDTGASALPAEPETVEAHLVWYLTSTDADGNARRDEDDHLVADVSMTTLGIRLAAINKIHEYAGYAKPGNDPLVADFMRGARRYFGTRAVGAKEAIDHAALRAMVAATQGQHYGWLKDHAILLLRSKGLTCGQIARLSWGDIDITDDLAKVSVPKDRRGGGGCKVSLTARRSDPPGCPVAILRALREVSPGRVLGPVFVSDAAGARQMTRQGVKAICDAFGAPVGGYVGLPEAAPRDVRRLLTEGTEHRSGRALRDESLLTIGWYLAARRGNLAALEWRDLSFEDDSIRVLWRRSKTDQEGKGQTLWLREVPGMERSGIVSPTRALLEWRSWLTRHLGGDPTVLRPRDPVFPRLSRGGTPIAQPDGRYKHLSGARINQLVQEYAQLAGLKAASFEGGESRRKNPFGAHSLRAGLVTEAARGGKLPVSRIMEITGHQSASMVMRYVREANSREQSAVTDLLGKMLGS